MAISLLMPDGLALTAQQERQAKAPQHGGGSGRPLGGRSGFRVGTPSNILTATSTTWTLGACAIEIDPGAAVDQGMYGWANSANTTGAMTAADATYARKDIVYIQINDPTSGDGTGSLSYAPQYLAGPMDGTNQPPALPPRSFLVGTISVPQAGGGSPTVTRNPAVYVAAGAPLPVSSQAERDALSLYDGLTVRRMDVAGRPTETYDGAAWIGGLETYTFPADFTGGWTTIGKISRARLSDGTYRYFIDFSASRNIAGFNVNGSLVSLFTPIPTAWAPNVALNPHFYGALNDNFMNFVGPLNVQIDKSNGVINVSTLTGNTLTLPQFGNISFTGQWTQ